MHVGVIGTGTIGEVRIQTQTVVKECGLGADGALSLTVGVGSVAASIKDVTNGIDGAVGKSAVRVEDRRARVALVGDVTPDVAAAFSVLGFRHYIPAVCDVGIGRDLEPRGSLIAHFHTAVIHLI